ncbi:MAG: NAD-glutamate dehydrogenase, partial [Candidatus Omnitrophica bacterium]|nr:NAD-glutamate dehydrogenase [Candidatus Omnitrophota bacterium]
PPSPRKIQAELEAYRRKVAITLVEDTTGADIFNFLTHLVSCTFRTNFYKPGKRSFSFWLSSEVLDPTVFPGKVYSVILVVGFHAAGTHMRAGEIARGGLRLIRATPTNYENVLDEMPLLNYALGPVAQRLKHKDIAEDGAKGVIVPDPEYTGDGQEVILDYGEGIFDLIQPHQKVVDYLKREELIFFGPDEGTASFMDLLAERGRARGYRHWRTISSGKSIGLPHDAYGLTADGKLFGLHSYGKKGTGLEIEGEMVTVTQEPKEILRHLTAGINYSGMTTTGILACLRTLIKHLSWKEENLNLMMTGGPDGDLGSNLILSFQGRICLIVDSGAVLFDPEGLDKEELAKLALARHTLPRLNSLAYPERKLSRGGFKIPRQPQSYSLPDGSKVEDGSFFHRNVLFDLALRPWLEKAGINVFIPCGGFKDTINAGNVSAFLSLFPQLRFIVEGANVFFDETSRDFIARNSAILQIRDFSANKGGVTCSSLAEVLPAFLLGDDYEKALLKDSFTRAAFVREILEIIRKNCEAETRVLLGLHEKTGQSLPSLSLQTSQWLLTLQDHLYSKMEILLSERGLVEKVVGTYVPQVLLQMVGISRAVKTLSCPDLVAYRNALITKKLASLALYRYAQHWQDFLKQVESDCLKVIRCLLE